MKKLHRLIVLSAVYRQSSRHPDNLAMMDSGMQTDPSDRLLWRFPIRRMVAEQIRDSMLSASGELDLTEGGAGSDMTASRRSVYLKTLRNKREPLLEAFDQPDRIVGTGSRNTTTSPTQSLLMINGEWTLQRASHLAERVEKEIPGGDDSQIRQAFRIVYARDPSEAEIGRGLEFLAQARGRKVASSGAENAVPDAALVDFCHVLLNSNEFLYVD
jgi:hypothetical protein